VAQTFTDLLHQCLPESARKAEREEAWRRFQRLGKVADRVLGEMAALDEKHNFYGREKIRRVKRLDAAET